VTTHHKSFGHSEARGFRRSFLPSACSAVLVSMSSRRMPSKYKPLNYKRPVKSYDPHQLVEVLGLQDDPEYFESLKVRPRISLCT
jgi:hypothetical protein